jgi:hypothetical protein
MRHVAPPAPPDLTRELKRAFTHDPQFKAWLRRYGDDATEQGDAPPTRTLSQDELTWLLVEVEKRRGGMSRDGRLRFALRKQMVAMTPKLGQPDWTSDVDDLRNVWLQPEMVALWARWNSPRARRARGPLPNDAAGKAFMSVLAMTGKPTGLEVQEALTEQVRLRQVFADVEAAARAERAESSVVAADFQLATYQGHMKRMKHLGSSEARRKPMLEAQAAMFRSLCELRPGDGFGKRLLIDGCLMPAWVDQHGVGESPEKERRRRGRTPHAGARAVAYNRVGGKRTLAPGQKVVGTASRLHGSVAFARGYYYVAILDQASGWPLVSMLQDASVDESLAIVPLLSDLFEYYGDFIEPEAIAGDGAWDEERWHHLCEVGYGIAPVFRHTMRAKSSTKLAPSQSRTIKGFNHAGRLVALERGQVLNFHGFESASREDLRPGQMAPGTVNSAEYLRALDQREAKFRVRVTDPANPGGGRLSLPVSVDWRRLTRYPKYPEGKPDLYAFRVALLTRLRNQMEGHFSRMQTSFRLGTDGADRVRVISMDTVEGLLRLAELRMCALSLADERMQRAGPSERSGPPPGADTVRSARAGDLDRTGLPGRVGGGEDGSPATSPTSEGASAATTVIYVDFGKGNVVGAGHYRKQVSSNPSGSAETSEPSDRDA